MTHSLRFGEVITTRMPEDQAGVRVVRRHHFMAIDLTTARHPQTLLATPLNGQPLTVYHGAPLRLLVPVKLGRKNVKAITRITYTAERPKDLWAERGYSYYDGI